MIADMYSATSGLYTYLRQGVDNGYDHYHYPHPPPVVTVEGETKPTEGCTQALTLVMGPCMPPFLVSPDTELVGESPRSPRGLDLKGVMDWDTPEARVNCSLSSTLVLPLAATRHTVSHASHGEKSYRKLVNVTLLKSSKNK